MQKYDVALIVRVACDSWWSNADIVWSGAEKTEEIHRVVFPSTKHTGFVISSTGHHDGFTGQQMQDGHLPLWHHRLNHDLLVREVDKSAPCVTQQGAGGEGSSSDHCLPSNASRLAASCGGGPSSKAALVMLPHRQPQG